VSLGTSLRRASPASRPAQLSALRRRVVALLRSRRIIVDSLGSKSSSGHGLSRS
jgi:hypothetical protein